MRWSFEGPFKGWCTTGVFSLCDRVTGDGYCKRATQDIGKTLVRITFVTGLGLVIELISFKLMDFLRILLIHAMTEAK